MDNPDWGRWQVIIGIISIAITLISLVNQGVLNPNNINNPLTMTPTPTPAVSNESSGYVPAPTQPVETSAISELIKEGTVLRGTCIQYNYGSYPMVMKIGPVIGNTFSGRLHWPDLRNSYTQITGTIDPDTNSIQFTEVKLLSGSGIVLNLIYHATASGNVLEGSWDHPAGWGMDTGGKGGTYSLTVSSEDDPDPPMVSTTTGS